MIAVELAVVVAVAVGVTVGVVAADGDVTKDLCSLRVRCLLDYHCHFCQLLRSYAQDENTVLKKEIFISSEKEIQSHYFTWMETRNLTLPSSMEVGGSLVVPAMIGAIML